MRMYYPLPVTGENFPTVWDCVERMRIRARQHRAECAAAAIVSGICCLCLSVFLGCGLVYERGFSPIVSLARLFPRFDAVWGSVRAYAPGLEGGFLHGALANSFLILFVSLSVGLLGALLVWCVYHPFGRKLPEESPRDNASALLANAREALEYSCRIRPVGFAAFLFCFFAMEFMLLALCVLQAGSPEAASSLFVEILTPSAPLNYLLLFFGGTGGFAILYGAVLLVLWCILRLGLPYDFVADIECYHIFAGEKAGKLSSEELAEKRMAKAQLKCAQALAQEKAGAYPKAAALFLEAAHGGDVTAMEHYARHCLISDSRVPARYWLKRCVASGCASKNARKMLRRLRMGSTASVTFIREEKPPVQKRKKE